MLAQPRGASGPAAFAEAYLSTITSDAGGACPRPSATFVTISANGSAIFKTQARLTAIKEFGPALNHKISQVA